MVYVDSIYFFAFQKLFAGRIKRDNPNLYGQLFSDRYKNLKLTVIFFLIVVFILQQLCRGRRVGFVKDIYVKKNGDLALLTQSLTTRFPQGAVHEGKFMDVKIFVNIAAQDDDFTVIPGEI